MNLHRERVLAVCIAAVYDFVAFLVLLGIAAWCIWTPGGVYDKPDTTQGHVLDTWLLVGLLPSVLLTIAAGVIWAHTSESRAKR
jgi:hypothetical protein